MNTCEDVRACFPDVLTSGIPPDDRALAAHLERCPACSGKLQAMEETWTALSTAPDLHAPPTSRETALEHARRAVEADARRPALPDRLWTAVRGLAAPVGLGIATTLLVVSLFHVRGATGDLGAMEAVVTSLVLAGLLATVIGGVLQSGAAREVRGMFSGVLGSMGGYVVLTLLSPIPETVDFCRVTLLGDPALGLAQLCLVYLGVAALYAGAPMAIAAYLRPEDARRWSSGALEAAIFTFLAAPVLVLQFGTADWMITGTGLLGLALGAALGGAAGVGARTWRPAPGRWGSSRS